MYPVSFRGMDTTPMYPVVPRRGKGYGYYPYTPKGYYPEEVPDTTPIPRRGTGYYPYTPKGYYPLRKDTRKVSYLFGIREKSPLRGIGVVVPRRGKGYRGSIP